MAEIKIFDKKLNQEIVYYMDDRVKKVIETKIKPSLEKKDKDCVIVIDGGEGTGKSTIGLQLAKAYDPTFCLDNVCFNAEEFRDAIFKAKRGQAIVYDEAFTGLSSRSSLSAVNRVLVSLMMQMRQKNLFVIIILPTFFLLDKYVALFRTRVLFHVYESGGRRGYFRVYNKKKKRLLYLIGKNTYSYSSGSKKTRVFTKFKGRFYGKFALGDEKEENKYRKKKEKALMDTEKNPMTAGQVKYREQRDICIFLLRKYLKLGYEQIEKLFGDYDFEMSYVQIRNICVKFGDKETDEEKRLRKDRKKENKVIENKNEMNFDDIERPILEDNIDEEEKEEFEDEDDEDYE